MKSPRTLPPTAPRRPGFTLLELLLVIAILALLAALLLPALRGARLSADRARELSAARQLMMAYRAYAYDHRGTLLPGYAPGLGLPAIDESGEDLSAMEGGLVAARYPWRLAPWMDFDLRGLYLDHEVLAQLQDSAQYPEYLVSLVPSLGINAAFLGGDFGGGGLANPVIVSQIGKWYASRLSEVRLPQNQIAFASARMARAQTPYPLPGGHEILEGYHVVEPPYLVERVWSAERFELDGAPGEFGHLSMRHRKHAVIGFLDGHTGTLDEIEIQDMRHWSDRADHHDWVIEP